MLSSDKNVETIGQLVQAVIRYLNLQKESIKFDVVGKLVQLLTVAALAAGHCHPPLFLFRRGILAVGIVRHDHGIHADQFGSSALARGRFHLPKGMDRAPTGEASCQHPDERRSTIVTM